MPLNYIVKKGDCISSISLAFGFSPEVLWKYVHNAALRELRGDMNTLYEGDVVVIPDRLPRQVACSTDLLHTFIRIGVPAYLRFQVRVDGCPFAMMPFILNVEGTLVKGTTDSTGLLQAPIPPGARSATLRVGSPEHEHVFPLDLGGLDPIDTVKGVQGRLNNLGFSCGALTGAMNEATHDAIQSFQEYINHPNPDGELDDQTRTILKTLHDDQES